jgi:hypothetical protein
MHRCLKSLSGTLLTASLAAFSIAGEPVVIVSGTSPNHPRQPQLVVDERGTIHATFGVNHAAMYCRSDDGGKTFGRPIQLPGTYVMSLGMRRGPRIAATGKSICISFVGGKEGKGHDGDVLATYTNDAGNSWRDPVRVNDVPDAGREGLHAMAGGPKEHVCCVWLDLREKGTKIFAAVSTDTGKTWGKNVPVYQSPDGSVCECCHPSVAYDLTGKLYVMWRNSLAGSRDMFLTTSSDGGATFVAAVKLGTGTWPLKACPMDGGYVAVSPQGRIFTAWTRNNEIFLTNGETSNEWRIGAGRQPGPVNVFVSASRMSGIDWLGHSVFEQDGEVIKGLFPVVDGHRPLGGRFANGHVHVLQG